MLRAIFPQRPAVVARNLTPDAARPSYNMQMRRLIFLFAVCLGLTIPGVAQSSEGEKDANQNQAPPRSSAAGRLGRVPVAIAGSI